MQSKNNLPNLIIAGVTKAGTTSLFSYLSRHRNICASDVKETCFFLPLRYGEKISGLDEYGRHFRYSNGKKYLLEATPGYFCGNKKIPEAICRELGKIKILIVLRDPANRLLSFYRYLKGMTLIPESLSFDSYIAMCEDYNDRISKSPGEKREDLIYRGIMDGFYADFLPEWNDYFRGSLKIVFFERLKEDPALFMKEICTWLEIDPTIYLKGGYTVENRSVLYKSRGLHRIGLLLNKELEVVLRRFPKVKHGIRKLYYAINENHRSEGIPKETIAYVESIYKGPNRKLGGMLMEMGYRDLPEWVDGRKISSR